MTVALALDGDLLWPDSGAHGEVVVLAFGFGHYVAECSCGWTGRRRYLRAGAQFDAWDHSLHEKCDLSVPLVLPVARG